MKALIKLWIQWKATVYSLLTPQEICASWKKLQRQFLNISKMYCIRGIDNSSIQRPIRTIPLVSLTNDFSCCNKKKSMKSSDRSPLQPINKIHRLSSQDRLLIKIF